MRSTNAESFGACETTLGIETIGKLNDLGLFLRRQGLDHVNNSARRHGRTLQRSHPSVEPLDACAATRQLLSGNRFVEIEQHAGDDGVSSQLCWGDTGGELRWHFGIAGRDFSGVDPAVGHALLLLYQQGE